MPLVEELPVTSTVKVSAGWAYVPDTGPIAAQQPGTRDRRRAAATATAASRQGQTGSAKREKAIQQRLDSLSKENHKDVTLPIPPSDRARDKNRKVSITVKRILGYQKHFAHYLAEEEANNPNGVHYVLPNVQVQNEMLPPVDKVKRGGRGKRSRVQSPDRVERSRRSIDESRDPTVKEEDTVMQDVEDEVSYPAEWDDDPLLKSEKTAVPTMPSRRVMDLLTSEPPLTYNASRAVADGDGPPPRRFCGMCGYWARVKCRKCQDWTCGIMECWKSHEGLCIMASAM